MFDINKIAPKDIFQDTTVQYPLENLTGLFFHKGNVELNRPDRDDLYKNIVGLIMSGTKKNSRVVEVQGNKLLLTDKFIDMRGNNEEITTTLEIKDESMLSCSISVLSKKAWVFDVDVSDMGGLGTMSHLAGYLCNLADNFPWEKEAREKLQEITVNILIMSRDFVNNMSKEHGVLYPDNFPLFNQNTKQIIQLIKTKEGYVVERILDIN